MKTFKFLMAKRLVATGCKSGRVFDPRRLVPSQSACAAEMMDYWRKTACGQIQSRHRDGQVETSRPSASRIEIEHPANSLDPGPMRVAANDDVDPARNWIESQCFDVMQNIDAAPTERHHLCLRIMFRPAAGIDVPSDRNDRCNLLESGDNAWRTDIAGVEDMRHAREGCLDLGA
jgi:hypothetical protein